MAKLFPIFRKQRVGGGCKPTERIGSLTLRQAFHKAFLPSSYVRAISVTRLERLFFYNNTGGTAVISSRTLQFGAHFFKEVIL